MGDHPRALLAGLHRATLGGGERPGSPWEEMERALREGAGADAVRLPQPGPLEMPLTAALRARRSSRWFAHPSAMTAATLATLLGHAVGGAGVPLVAGGPPGGRPYPSGGGLYPVEVLVHATRVEGVAGGVHRYQELGHRLVPVARRLPPPRLRTLFNDHPVDDAAAVVLLAADLGRPSLGKYGTKEYRLLLLEAGHAAQNVLLIAAALGLAALPLCGFRDDELAAACGLEPPGQVVVYAVALGDPA